MMLASALFLIRPSTLRRSCPSAATRCHMSSWTFLRCPWQVLQAFRRWSISHNRPTGLQPTYLSMIFYLITNLCFHLPISLLFMRSDLHAESQMVTHSEPYQADRHASAHLSTCVSIYMLACLCIRLCMHVSVDIRSSYLLTYLAAYLFI